MNVLVLLDIDGTLLRCGAAPRNALRAAMDSVFGTHGALDAVRFGGKTDRLIVREALPQAPPWDDPAWEAFWRLYAERLGPELSAHSMPEVLPGVTALLDALAARPDTALGLVTGNVAAGCRAKLRHAGLEGFFWRNGDEPLAVYGDQGATKADLGAVARSLAEARDGGCPRLVLVGDTPADVDCARQAGARAVAVATGAFDAAVLAAHGADAVLASFQPLAGALEAIFPPAGGCATMDGATRP